MLERAAGSLESAGQCLLRESGRITRSKRILGSNFWRSRALELLRLQYFAFAQPRRARPADGRNDSDDLTEPALLFLDFLYPPKTQALFSSWLLKDGNIFTRRRQKRSVEFLRSFASGANIGLKPHGHRARDIDKRRLQLWALLENPDPSQSNKAWDLYTELSHDRQLRSLVLQYFSRFPTNAEHARVVTILNSIPPSERTTHDYLHMIRFLIQSGDFSDATILCSEAIASGTGSLAWDFALAASIKALQWDSVLDLWKLKPPNAEIEWPCEALREMFSTSNVSGRIVDFQSFIKKRKQVTLDRNIQSFGRWLLDSWSSSPNAVKKTTTEMILSFTQGFQALGCLDAEHYYQAINILCSFNVRWQTARSVVLYRNFRWLLNDIIPPKALLHNLLEAVAAQEIADSVQYLLDDFALFYGKPSTEAYKKAMVTFSRTGDASKVEDIFQKLMKDHGDSHGIPKSLRWVTPLLYVHARVGDVENTMKEFNRISEEFGLEANTVCWNIVLTAFATAGDADGALSTLERMLASCQRPDSYTFGTLMGLCANRGDIDNVRQLFRTANEKGVKITTAMVDTVIEVYCNNQCLQKAEEMAEAAISMHLQGSRTRMWNILLWVYAYRADLPSISRIRARMDQARIPPDGMTYAALMLALARIGQPDHARRLLRAFHRSRRVYATEFHYAILLYAYVKARNRDMIHVIYKEIQDRFKSPGLSSQLLALKGYIQRYLQAQKKRSTPGEASRALELTENYLAERIAHFNRKMLATKQPQPGVAKMALKDAFPSLFYEQMMAAHNKTHSYAKTQKQLKDFQKYNEVLGDASDPDVQSTPLHLIARTMSAHLGRREYAKVEECWKSALKEASKVTKQVDFSGAFASSKRSAKAETPPRPIAPPPPRVNKSLLVNEMPTAATTDEGPKIPSQRFILSNILSIYLKALGEYKRTTTIPQVIKRLQKSGFALTTQNWSTYVQVLAKSPRVGDQVEAFIIFEEKYMARFPGWEALRRGYAIRPESAASTIDYIDNPTGKGHPGLVGKRARRFWSKIHPDYMYPTYVTLVHLASALLDLRERSVLDGGQQLSQVYSIAPRTIQALTDMPYLRERFQGVLLRNRDLEGDRETESSEKYAWTGGVLGVDGEARLPKTFPDVDPQREHPSFTDISESGTSSEITQADEAAPEEHLQRTLAYEDEQDIEAETLLETRRRQLGIDPLFEDEPESEEYI